jgi:hypothetical protein
MKKINKKKLLAIILLTIISIIDIKNVEACTYIQDGNTIFLDASTEKATISIEEESGQLSDDKKTVKTDENASEKVWYVSSLLKVGDASEETSSQDCSEECNDLAPAIRLVKIFLIPVIQIGIPIFLIVMGMLDLGKAVIASKEEEMKKAQSMFIKRCIYGLAVFFVVSIVVLVFKLFPLTGADKEVSGTQDWLTCWNNVDKCTK